MNGHGQFEQKADFGCSLIPFSAKSPADQSALLQKSYKLRKVWV